LTITLSLPVCLPILPMLQCFNLDDD